MYIGWCKGANAYELQIGRLYIRLNFLSYWFPTITWYRGFSINILKIQWLEKER